MTGASLPELSMSPEDSLTEIQLSNIQPASVAPSLRDARLVPTHTSHVMLMLTPSHQPYCAAPSCSWMGVPRGTYPALLLLHSWASWLSHPGSSQLLWHFLGLQC